MAVRASKSSERSPLVAIVGGKGGFDSFLAEEHLERTLAHAVGEDRTDSVEIFRGEETSWGRVQAALRTGSLFATRRAVVVKNVDQIRGKAEEGEDESGGVLTWIDDPAPDVVFVLTAAKPDMRRKIWKAASSRGALLSAEPLKGKALESYVQRHLAGRGLSLDSDAFTELVERVGQDLRRLMGEVDKLQAFAGDRKKLRLSDVEAVLGRGLSRPLWELSDAAGDRDGARMLRLMEGLLDEGEEALRLLATLYRSLRQTRLALALGEESVPRTGLASRMGLPPPLAFKADRILEAARRWPKGRLEESLEVLRRADGSLKRSAEPRATLAAAVAVACGRDKGREGESLRPWQKGR